MNRKLIITKMSGKIWSALFENGHAVELHCVSEEQEQKSATLGDIYVGKVKKIVKNINAAFIEIADGLECYYAMDENQDPIFTNKIGKKTLCVGDELLVQISKEALKTKVPTVSSKLNFTGKYVVLTHGDIRIGVSNKIAKTDRERLQQIVNPYGTKTYGFIVRTNAKDAEIETIEREIKSLILEYETLIDRAKTRVCFSCLKTAPKQYLTELRNVYQNGELEILVEDEVLYEEIHDFLEKEQPEDLKKLNLYKDSLLPLHKLYSIEKCIENATKERVWLKSGAYLVIQPTEALTVIDVNTGKCVSNKYDTEAMLKINLEAAMETARQIRLRNLSGIILVDFINLDHTERMQILLKTLDSELRKDPIETLLVDVTKLQLVEITRKKVRKPLHETVCG